MLALTARFCRPGATRAASSSPAVLQSFVSTTGASRASAMFFSSIPGFPAPPCTPVPWKTPTTASQPLSSSAEFRLPTVSKMDWREHPSSPIPMGWVLDDDEAESLQLGNRNARVPKKANHGARPCSRVRRRWMRRRFGAWRRS